MNSSTRNKNIIDDDIAGQEWCFNRYNILWHSCGAGVLLSDNYFSFQKRIQNLGLSFIYRDLKCLVHNEAYQ